MATAADKRQDFLWIVQMIGSRYGDDVVGWPGMVGDAVAASHRIPNDMTARDAALDFCAFVMPGMRGGEERLCPRWLTFLSDPVYQVD